MAKFRIFNVQLLPNHDGIEEVGKAGYRKLFSQLNKLNKKHFSAKTHPQFHFQLPADTFFGPFEFNFPAGYVYGHFVRYTRTDKVVDLETDRTLFKNIAKKAAVSSKHMIPFVFDTDRHYLAMDGGAGLLPKTGVVITALEKFLEDVVEEYFPNHTLTINLISRKNALEQVFNDAVSYKVINANLTFPNGHDLTELLRELKESKTQTITLNVSAGKKGRMSSVPSFVKGLLRASIGLGFATITYFVADNSAARTRREMYDSRDTPLTFSVRHSPKDLDESDYFERIAGKLNEIDIENATDEEE